MKKIQCVIVFVIVSLMSVSCSNANNTNKLEWIPDALPSQVEMLETTNDITQNQEESNGDNALSEKEQQDEIPEKVCVLGNSITLGFGSHGMASSRVDTDYYHILKEYLTELNPSLEMKRIPGFAWEGSINSEQRAIFLEEELTVQLGEDCDLLIIQLGDNVNTAEKLTTFQEDCKYALAWLMERYPKLQVMWVFGRYNLSNAEAIREACDMYGADYVDISLISTDTCYMAKIGDYYEKEDGTMGVIADAGVASHPNDLGMQMIAEKIIEVLQYK